MEIKVTCKGAVELDISELTEFQGGLKVLSAERKLKLRKSILKYGISFPFFVYSKDGVNYIEDGHQRLICLKELISEGYVVGKLPCALIYADSMQEAKEKLLILNSRYGEITESGFFEFSEGLNLEGFGDLLELPDIDIFPNEVKVPELKEVEVDLKPYKKTHILISIPPDKLIDVQDKLNEILKVQGVEYEQGSN